MLSCVFLLILWPSLRQIVMVPLLLVSGATQNMPLFRQGHPSSNSAVLFPWVFEVFLSSLSFCCALLAVFFWCSFCYVTLVGFQFQFFEFFSRFFFFPFRAIL